MQFSDRNGPQLLVNFCKWEMFGGWFRGSRCSVMQALQLTWMLEAEDRITLM